MPQELQHIQRTTAAVLLKTTFCTLRLPSYNNAIILDYTLKICHVLFNVIVLFYNKTYFFIF